MFFPCIVNYQETYQPGQYPTQNAPYPQQSNVPQYGVNMQQQQQQLTETYFMNQQTLTDPTRYGQQSQQQFQQQQQQQQQQFTSASAPSSGGWDPVPENVPRQWGTVLPSPPQRIQLKPKESIHNLHLMTTVTPLI